MMEVYAKKKHYLDYQAKRKVFQMIEQRNSWTQNRTSKEDFQTQCFQQACQFKSDYMHKSNIKHCSHAINFFARNNFGVIKLKDTSWAQNQTSQKKGFKC